MKENLRNSLFAFDAVLKTDTVFFAQNDDDLFALSRAKFDFVITTCAGDAQAWRDEYAEIFANKRVNLLIRHNEIALKIAKSLYRFTKNVYIIENLPSQNFAKFFDDGGTTDEILELVNKAQKFQPSADDLKEINKNSKFRFEFTTLDDLYNEPAEKIAFLWEKTLPSGGFSICSAKPKTGKSVFARNLAVAMSRGQSFLGRETVKSKILYLCLEEKRSEIRNHFLKMSAIGDDILIHSNSSPKSLQEAIDALSDAISQTNANLVIIDPLSRVLRVSDFNDYQITHSLEKFVDLARERNTHILALHHDSKSDRFGGDAILGSTAIFGAVDCHIQMRKKDSYRTISTTQRYGEDLQETILQLDPQTGIISAKCDLKTAIVNDVKTEILACFVDDATLTQTDIKSKLKKFNSGEISKTLQMLVNENKLAQAGNGRKKDAFLYRKI